MSFTDYTEAAMLNALFGKTSDFGSLSSRPTIFLGLSSQTPDDDGSNVLEPSTNGYARLETATTDWNLATEGDPSTLTNAVELEMATASGGSWLSDADLTYAVFYDLSTGGELLFYGQLNVAKPVLEGDTPRFAIGDITISLT